MYIEKSNGALDEFVRIGKLLYVPHQYQYYEKLIVIDNVEKFDTDIINEGVYTNDQQYEEEIKYSNDSERNSGVI